ncbi:DUF3054 domain-containing protein [Bellilinea sp.]|uniref:DUF3054 domain-containing protein n=1 Tax=Bellilinea caldifistulae TaxID=360411 RepID=A0A7C4KZ28_9CHLR
MKSRPVYSSILFLILMDGIILLLVTFIGFASHSTSLAGGRWLATFLPMLAGWLVAGWLGGVFHPDISTDYRQLWRVMGCAALAAPFGAVLRGLWLQNVVMPVFALVMMAVSAVGLLIWRVIWIAWITRKQV